MSATSPAQKYDQVLELLEQLSLDEQLRLIGDISSGLQKQLALEKNAAKTTGPKPCSIKGKYKHVRTSSERFAQSKRQEIELER